MLAPIGGVVSVARQGSEHLLVAVGKLYSCYHHVRAVLLGQTVRQPQPQSQRAIIANSGHAQLLTTRRWRVMSPSPYPQGRECSTYGRTGVRSRDS